MKIKSQMVEKLKYEWLLPPLEVPILNYWA